ncbi:MAG: response regulator [Trueperaceae bacterium]|nr:response regulator [Trueperaceae bacterium]
MSAPFIVAVDDQVSILKTIEISLARQGYEVHTFDNPFDALGALRGGLEPDLIISDVSMPRLDGFAFCNEVRTTQRLRSVPFIFLTALTDRRSMRQGMALADDYLTKPFSKAELIDAVQTRLRRVWELRQVEQEPHGQAGEQGDVAVIALGQPLVERGGVRVDWDSLKALELFFYLLEHRTGATVYEIAELLWPGKSESKAGSSFHTTLYRLRKTLKSVFGGDAVDAANRRYYLSDQLPLDYDAARYRTLAATAKERQNLSDFASAIGLYGGDFLSGIDSPWVDEVRQALDTTQQNLLAGAARLAADQNDFQTATHYYRALVSHDPFSSAGWRGLIGTWEARGEPERAAEARRRFRDLFPGE